ncbi:hypothetical protein PACILC2_07070 [Paenibacillus cisolokensis]|uniref:Uncharacterized protein n=1 Tax=Paenibacillus cisolokensis TaxID=1658519 RepID=A0ABQ4N1U0_9BACL|nr:hypothetical protein PACILC2_07070 [Paenibacillus cisolokensis]
MKPKRPKWAVIVGEHRHRIGLTLEQAVEIAIDLEGHVQPIRIEQHRFRG